MDSSPKMDSSRYYLLFGIPKKKGSVLDPVFFKIYIFWSCWRRQVIQVWNDPRQSKWLNYLVKDPKASYSLTSKPILGHHQPQNKVNIRGLIHQRTLIRNIGRWEMAKRNQVGGDMELLHHEKQLWPYSESGLKATMRNWPVTQRKTNGHGVSVYT